MQPAVVDPAADSRPSDVESWRQFDLSRAGSSSADAVLRALGSSPEGLSDEEAMRRLKEIGPNTIQAHGVHPAAVFIRQLENPLLILLAG